MAKTIGQLTAVTTFNPSTDEFVIEQSGQTFKVAASVVRGGLVNANIDAAAAIVSTKLSTATQESLVPAGAIMPFARSTAPSGWLACDGAEVAVATYGTLSTAIYVGDGSNADTDLVYGFKTNGSGTRSTSGTHVKLPDLRGEFIRGWDSARGIDSSRKNRSYQADATQGHQHAITDPGHLHAIQYYQSTGGGDAAASAQILNAATGVTATATTGISAGNPTTDGTNGAPRTAAETRPRNVTALYCIKF